VNTIGVSNHSARGAALDVVEKFTNAAFLNKEGAIVENSGEVKKTAASLGFFGRIVNKITGGYSSQNIATKNRFMENMIKAYGDKIANQAMLEVSDFNLKNGKPLLSRQVMDVGKRAEELKNKDALETRKAQEHHDKQGSLDKLMAKRNEVKSLAINANSLLTQQKHRGGSLADISDENRILAIDGVIKYEAALAGFMKMEGEFIAKYNEESLLKPILIQKGDPAYKYVADGKGGRVEERRYLIYEALVSKDDIRQKIDVLKRKINESAIKELGDERKLKKLENSYNSASEGVEYYEKYLREISG